jgi:hypothetical protein
MPNEINNTITTEANFNLEQERKNYPYLMQYQFTGNIFPSFSSVQQVPVDVRFVYSLNSVKSWIPNFQIRAAWDVYLSDKRNFRERHNYPSARFDFFYQKANKHIDSIPDFTVILSKVIIIVKEYEHGIQWNHLGTISFTHQHSHCYGNFPPHFRKYSHSTDW